MEKYNSEARSAPTNTKALILSKRPDFAQRVGERLSGMEPLHHDPPTDHDGPLGDAISWLTQQRRRSDGCQLVLLVDGEVFSDPGPARFSALQSLYVQLGNDGPMIALITADLSRDRRLALDAGARFVLAETFAPDHFYDLLEADIKHDTELRVLKDEAVARVSRAKLTTGVLGVCGTIAAILATHFLPILIHNRTPTWCVTDPCVSGRVATERVEYSIHLVNSGMTPVTGITVAELSPNVCFEGIGVGQPVDKIDPGRTAVVKFSIRDCPGAPLGNRKDEMWIKLKGPGLGGLRTVHVPSPVPPALKQ